MPGNALGRQPGEERMIQIICSIYFIVVFWKRAKSNEKLPWLWSIGGAICFISISGLLPVVVAHTSLLVGVSPEGVNGLFFISVFVGLPIAFYLTNLALKRILPSPWETAIGRF